MNQTELLQQNLFSNSQAHMLQRDKIFFTYPPNIQLAQKHRSANRIFKQYSQIDSTKECKCCARMVGDDQSQTKSILFDPIELAFLGPGLPLFFGFIKNAIFLMFSFTIIYASFCLFQNKMTGNCLSNGKCDNNFIDTFSILNEQDSVSGLQKQLGFMLTFTVISVFVLQFLRNQVQKLNDKCDFILDSPSDYAIIIRRLPQNITEQNIRDMVHKLALQKFPNQPYQRKKLQINHIVFSYSMKEYRNVKKNNINNFRKSIQEDTYQSFVPEKFEGFKESGDVCIVVFERQQAKEFFHYEPTFYQNLLQCLWSSCIPESHFQVNGEKVFVQRAPEPDDIIWENANVQIEQAVKRKTLFNILAFGLLLIGCGIQYALALVQSYCEDSTKTIIGIISSLLISLSNFGILYFLRYSSSKEKNLTKTEENSVLMVKISLLQFLNAGVFLLLSKSIALGIFDLTPELIFEINTIMIINGISHNVSVFVLDYLEIPHKFSLFLVKNGLLKPTQNEMNQIYQTPLPDMPYKYAYVLKTLWLTGFYTSFVPFSAFYTLIGLTINYFIEKKLFTGTYSAPTMFSSVLNQKAIKLMEMFPLIVSFGGLTVFFYSQEQATGLCFIYAISSIAISLFIIFLPFQKLAQKLFESQKHQSFHFEHYSDLQKNFETTYEMTNPACNKKRKRVMLENVRKKIFIGQNIQITINQNQLLSNNYRIKIQNALYDLEEERLRNEEEDLQKEKNKKENQRIQREMYEMMGKNTLFNQKKKDKEQNIKKNKDQTNENELQKLKQENTQDPSQYRRMIREMQVYDPICSNEPKKQNQKIFYGADFKNLQRDQNYLRNLIGYPFQKQQELKDHFLSKIDLDDLENAI